MGAKATDVVCRGSSPLAETTCGHRPAARPSRCLREDAGSSPAARSSSIEEAEKTMEHTLLLNATFEPIKVVSWQRAMTLWCQGRVEIIETHDREVRAVTFSFKLPSIVRLLR